MLLRYYAVSSSAYIICINACSVETVNLKLNVIVVQHAQLLDQLIPLLVSAFSRHHV